MADEVIITVPPPTVVVIDPTVTPPGATTEVVIGGGQGGARGPIGPTGPTGPAGPEKTLAYRHRQMTSSAVWNITHNLDFYPNVTTMDSTGAICEGEIEHITRNSLRVTFSGAFSGDAYLS